MKLLVRFLENQRFAAGQRTGRWALVSSGIPVSFLARYFSQTAGRRSSFPYHSHRTLLIWSPSLQLCLLVPLYIRLIIIFHLTPFGEQYEWKVLKIKRNTNETKELRSTLEAFTWNMKPKATDWPILIGFLASSRFQTPFGEMVI